MKTLGWILFIVAVLVIIYIINKNGKAVITGDAKSEQKITCELKDVNGKSITITGAKDDAQFIKMCQLQPSQPVYVYGFPYIISHTRHSGEHN